MLPFFSRWHKKAAKRYPQLEEACCGYDGAQAQAEQRPKPGLTLRLTPRQICSASVLSLEAKDELQQRVFYEFGYHIGRWIYFMDAADDLEKDIKHNSFNPFKSYTGDDLQGYQTRLLNQSLARAYDAYNLIEIVDFKGILDNMLLYGFPSKQNTVVYRPQEVKDEKSV